MAKFLILRNVGFQFSAAQASDSDTLLLWRNDPETRKQSFHSHLVSPEEHRAWFEKSLSNPLRQLHMVRKGSELIGCVRYDLFPEHCELSWTVAPSARGKGLGTAMVQAALKRHPRREVRAYIKASNQPSVRIAEHAGFQLELQSEGVMTWIWKSPN